MFCATGMHGGTIYLNGKTEKFKLGKEAAEVKLKEEDITFLKKYIDLYAKYFKKDLKSLKIESFVKYAAVNKNAYKNMYYKYWIDFLKKKIYTNRKLAKNKKVDNNNNKGQRRLKKSITF